MPTWAYALTRTAFLDVIKKYRSVSKDNFKICFMVDRDEALRTFPLFRFELPDKIWLELTPIQYLATIVISKGQIGQCVALMDAEDNSEGVAFGSTNMLDMLISYDYTNKKLGFMEHNCDCFLLPEATCIDGNRTKGGRDSPALWVPTRFPIEAPNPAKKTLTDESVTAVVDGDEHVKTRINVLTETTGYPISHPSSENFDENAPTVPPARTFHEKPKFISFLGIRFLKIMLAFSLGICTSGASIILVSRLWPRHNYIPLQTSDRIPQFANELEIIEMGSLTSDEDDTAGLLL